MADGSKRRKCFSTDEVLQFLLGSAEEDETLHDDSKHLSEDSEDDSRDEFLIKLLCKLVYITCIHNVLHVYI